MFQILIADSDRAYRRRLYQLLRREGYSVLQASGGEDVLKVRADKDLYLGLGWLLREDKVVLNEQDGEFLIKLK